MVDYVALCHALVKDENLHPDDITAFSSLATHLTALREAVTKPEIYRAIEALTHTDQEDEP